MSALSAPPIDPSCDLRGMPFMPLDIVRLFDSDLYALSTGDEFKAAFSLWGKAFLQVPAGSLPKEDRILAHLSGAGSKWAKVRDMALRGWVEASDGRLYHPVVVEKAKEAWAARLAQRARTEAARAARAASRSPATSSVTGSVTENITGSKGQGQGQGQSTTSQPPSPPDGKDEEVDERSAHVLKFISARGGHLHHHGEDRRPGWLEDTAGMSIDQIGAVFDWARSRGRRIIYPGEGEGYFGWARKAMDDARKAEITRQRQQVEQETQRTQERAEQDERAKRAAEYQARQRAEIAALLALADEWTDRLTDEQAAIIGELRITFDARKSFGLTLGRKLDKLPSALVEQAKARANEHTEEGITA